MNKVATPPSPAKHAAASASPGAMPAEEARRVGSFAALAGWIFGLLAGIIVTALSTARPMYLFGVVGIPVVLVSYFLGTFAGGRISRTYFRTMKTH
jgi:hypothetical protein